MEAEEDGVPFVDLRSYLLTASSEATLHYTLGAFRFETAEGTEQSCNMRLWIGLLEPTLEDCCVLGEEDEAADRGFVVTGSEVVIQPYGPSLASIARDHFEFQSAAEEVSDGAPSQLTARVEGLEKALQGVQSGLDAVLQKLTGPAQAKPPQPSKPDLPARKAVREAPAGPAPAPGLDESVLAAARAAGIPEHQLQRMGELAMKPGRLGDGARKAATVLSESDEEAADGGAETEGHPEDVTQAICQMTRILKELSAKSRPSGSLEDLLDRGGSLDSASGSGSAGGSSKAAAYHKLTRLLKEDPEKISRSILKLMGEDFAGQRTAPGLDGMTMTARGWLEHRSRVQQYAGPARWGWQTAGALDALLAGRSEEAKARLCLMLCALDQSSLDAGNWLLAQEMHLEPGPPMASFARHRGPEPGEDHHTRIMDPRWLAVLVHRIKERESFIETRKKLGGAGRGAPPPPTDVDKAERGDKPPKGRGRGKAPE